MLKTQFKYVFKPALWVLLLDQLTKLYILHTPRMQNVHVMRHLNFHLGYNKGAAFGLFGTAGGWQRWVFVGVALFISVVIFAWSRRLSKQDRFECLALGLVLGGAWGNLLDRIRLGYVVDFIDFYIGSWHWYTFNIADIGICLGAAVLFLLSFRR